MIPNYICDNNCRHCCIKLTGDSLSEERVSRLADEIVSVRPSFVGITGGGEPFNTYDLLKILCTKLGKAGIRVGIVTSADWATNYETAVEKLTELKPCMVTVSYDEWHQEKIPEENVENLLKACEKLGIVRTVHHAISTVEWKLKARTIANKYRALLSTFPVLFKRIGMNISMPYKPCGNYINPTIAPDGWHICCNSIGVDRWFVIADVDESLEKAWSIIRSSDMVQKLMRYGPTYFVKPEPGRYRHQCELCYDIFRDKSIS